METPSTSINILPEDNQHMSAIVARIQEQKMTDQEAAVRLLDEYTFSSPEVKEHFAHQIRVLMKTGAMHQAPVASVRVEPIFTDILGEGQSK